jgi:hypothetical protein
MHHHAAIASSRWRLMRVCAGNEYLWVKETVHSSCYRLRIARWAIMSFYCGEKTKQPRSEGGTAVPATKRQKITPVVQSTQSPLLDSFLIFERGSSSWSSPPSVQQRS